MEQAAVRELSNQITPDMKLLANTLKSLSKRLYEKHESVFTQLLLGVDKDLGTIIDGLLKHLLRISQQKQLCTQCLSILVRLIEFLKLHVPQNRVPGFLCEIVDILTLLRRNHPQQQVSLRIIQATFSLADAKLLRDIEYGVLIKIYSICLDHCQEENTLICSISISALSSFTEAVVSVAPIAHWKQILYDFLNYMLEQRRFSWIKNSNMKGLILDLILIVIRKMPKQLLTDIAKSPGALGHFQHLYSILAGKCFSSALGSLNPTNQVAKSMNNANSPNTVASDILDGSKHALVNKNHFLDFVRSYKSFVYLSIHLGINAVAFGLPELVPFSSSIHLFNTVLEVQRGPRILVFLEGIQLILTHKHRLMLDEQEGIVLFDVLSKVAEELYLSEELIEQTYECSHLLERMSADFRKVSNGQIYLLTRRILVQVRKKFEANSKMAAQQQPQTERRRWEKLIRVIIKIVRYLSSVNMAYNQDHQSLRRLINELQLWFLITPVKKSRHLILDQLLLIASTIGKVKAQNTVQALKVSQCVQIGSNLINGYHDILDSVGIATILKMMASVNADWEDGRNFDELSEVFSMAQRLYTQHHGIRTPNDLKVTLHAFFQGVNSLISNDSWDGLQMKGNDPNHVSSRSSRILNYMLEKLNIIIVQKAQDMASEWSFVTGFWISLCTSKNEQIRLKAMQSIGEVMGKLFSLGTNGLSQKLILEAYLELAKIVVVDKPLVSHLTAVPSQLRTTEGVMQMFRIINLLSEHKPECSQLGDLRELLVKEQLYRVQGFADLGYIVSNFNTFLNNKNDQYRTLTLLWTVGDHLKSLKGSIELEAYRGIWKCLFIKILVLAENSHLPEANQSAIHTLTNLLSQATIVLPAQDILQAFEGCYLSLFHLLLSKSLISRDDESKEARMIKPASQNMLKMLRKCIASNILPHKKDTIMDKVLKNIRSLLLKISSEETSQKGSSKNIQLPPVPPNSTLPLKFSVQKLYELVFFCLQLNQAIFRPFFNLPSLLELLKTIEASIESKELKTFIYLKKYVPLFEEALSKVNESIASESKGQVVTSTSIEGAKLVVEEKPTINAVKEIHNPPTSLSKESLQSQVASIQIKAQANLSNAPSPTLPEVVPQSVKQQNQKPHTVVESDYKHAQQQQQTHETTVSKTDQETTATESVTTETITHDSQAAVQVHQTLTEAQ